MVSEHCEVGMAETQSTKSAFSIPRVFLFGAFSLQRRPSASQVLQDFKWLSGSVNSPHFVVTQTSLQYQNKSYVNLRITYCKLLFCKSISKSVNFFDFLCFEGGRYTNDWPGLRPAALRPRRGDAQQNISFFLRLRVFCIAN